MCPNVIIFPKPARQNFASPNFCLGSLERFGAEQIHIPEFPHAYKEKSKYTLRTQRLKSTKMV
jgi:hypothetical protein